MQNGIQYRKKTAVVSGDVMGPAVLFCHLAVRRGVMDGPSQKERISRDVRCWMKSRFCRLSNEKGLVVPSGCLSARAVPHPPAIGISSFSAFFLFSHAGRVFVSYNVTRVQSATEWTAAVHTLHMPKPVM